MLKKNAAKQNFTVFVPPSNHPDATKLRPVAKRYWKMKEILKDYIEINKMPDTIHLKPIEANTLIFEDLFYNFTPEMYVDIFEQTNAKLAYGYGVLPLELIFPDMPDNNLYLTENYDGKTTLVFRNGFCNGHAHDTEAWATLLRNPVITNKHHSITLARVGPMAIFKIYRCSYKEAIVRCIEVTDKQKYVKILDVRACVNRSTGKVIKPLKYFSVFEEKEYLDIYNYVLSLDPKSVSFQNIVAYIRRRMG